MKFRRGFVTNSSSSSFVCEVCGCAQAGYDMSLYEAEFVMCENGHEFCQEHMVNVPEKDDNKWSFDYEEFFDSIGGDGRYCLPAIYCPICQMQILSDYDLMSYLAAKGFTRNNVLEEIRASFPDYDAFHKFLEENQNEN